MTMADVVAVMNKGRIEQMGAPRELYELPKTAFVANFLGKSNLMRGKVVGREGDYLLVEAAGGVQRLRADRAVSDAGEVVLGVRPEKMRIFTAGEASVPEGHNRLDGTIVDASFTGVSTEFLVDVPGVGTVGTFTQNMGQVTGEAGDPAVMCWDPDFTFGLAGDDDVAAGAAERDS